MLQQLWESLQEPQEALLTFTGVDNACELRIKEDIRVVKEEIISIKESWELAHNELNKKIDNIKGSQDIILDLFKHNITPK
jgi:hypothetical protein